MKTNPGTLINSAWRLPTDERDRRAIYQQRKELQHRQHVVLSECAVPCYLEALELMLQVMVCGCLVEVVCESRSVIDGLEEVRLGVFLVGELLEIVDDAGQEDALDHVYT